MKSEGDGVGSLSGARETMVFPYCEAEGNVEVKEIGKSRLAGIYLTV